MQKTKASLVRAALNSGNNGNTNNNNNNNISNPNSNLVPISTASINNSINNTSFNSMTSGVGRSSRRILSHDYTQNPNQNLKENSNLNTSTHMLSQHPSMRGNIGKTSPISLLQVYKYVHVFVCV